jgi:hypothetical protein
MVVSGGNLQISKNQKLSSITLTNGTLTIDAGVTLTVTNASIAAGFNLINNGTLVIEGALTDNRVTKSFSGLVRYAANSGSQTILSASYNDLELTGNATKNLVDNVVVNGNFNLTTGSLVLGTNTLNRNTNGGTFTMGANTSLFIGGTNTFPTNYATHSLDATSTVEYNGNDQDIVKLSNDYGKVILSNSGTKTLANDLRTAGDFTLQNSVVSEILTGNSLTVGDDFIVLDTADFTVNSNAYLIQTKAGANANVGSIKVNRTASIKRLDIVLWSPAVAGQNLLAFSPETLQNRFFQSRGHTNLYYILL